MLLAFVLVSFLWRASSFKFKNQQGGRLMVTLWYLQVVGGLVVTGNWVYQEELYPITAFITSAASFKLYAADCLGLSDWWDDFAVTMSIPPAIVLFGLMLYIVMTRTGFASARYTRPKCLHLVLMVWEFWYFPGAVR